MQKKHNHFESVLVFYHMILAIYEFEGKYIMLHLPQQNEVYYDDAFTKAVCTLICVYDKKESKVIYKNPNFKAHVSTFSSYFKLRLKNLKA